MKPRYKPPLGGEHAQMLRLLLSMVADEGVRPNDAARFLGVSPAFASEIMCLLRRAGQSESARNATFPRVFLWCLPLHAPVIAQRLAAQDAAAGTASAHGMRRRAGKPAKRNARPKKTPPPPAYDAVDEVDGEANDPFYAPVVHLTVPAAGAPRVKGGVPSVFHLAAAQGLEVAA